jgi:hypothetical protein
MEKLSFHTRHCPYLNKPATCHKLLALLLDTMSTTIQIDPHARNFEAGVRSQSRWRWTRRER